MTPERLADVLDAGEDFVLLDTRSDRKKTASYERVVDANRGVEDADAREATEVGPNRCSA